MNGKIIIGLAGMPGAGKSVVVNAAKENGYGIVVMGDVVREETVSRGLELNPQNIGKVMLDLREKEGKNVVAKRCVPKIEKSLQPKIIVDGVRSLNEVEEFKNHFPKFTLVAVHSSPETRFKRLYHRQRSDDPKNWQVFSERDMRELDVGLGEAIAMAEHIIINEEKYEVVKRKANEVLRKVEQKWTK